MDTSWSDQVLQFWFDEVRPEQHFTRDDGLDAAIRERFERTYEFVRLLDARQLTSAGEHLAAVIVLDQFPRNMFRGGPSAFATDAQALEISRQAIERELDRELTPAQRTFLYMPWQHSESRRDQARSVELFAALGVAEPLDYARQHKDVIDRFGRFPHRNAALGRASTDEEAEFMRTHHGF